MKPVFQKAHAETHNDFRLLTGNHKITFSYVYDGPSDLKFDLPDVEADEQYLAFDLAEHGEVGKRRFLWIGPLELRAGCPSPHPVPYWASYLRGVGNFAKAYSLNEARTLVLKSRAELKLIEKAFEKK